MNRLRGEAIGIFLFFATLILKWDDFVRLYNADIRTFILTVILALMAGGWFYGFYKAGIREQEWLSKYLDAKVVQPIGFPTYSLVFLLAIGFAFLIYFSDDILKYSAAMTILCFLDLWSTFLLKSKIRDAIDVSKKNAIEQITIERVNALDAYYFLRPWPQRIASTMLLNAIAFFFAFLSQHLKGTNDSTFMFFAYGIVIVGNVISLIVQYIWRKQAANIINDSE